MPESDVEEDVNSGRWGGCDEDRCDEQRNGKAISRPPSLSVR
jgi:hypothetical protein